MFLKIPMLLGDISIHTFSLYHTLRYEDYQNIFYHLKNADRDSLWPDKCPSSFFYSLPTLQVEKGLRVQLRNQTVCSINIIVSPLLLIQKQEDDYKRIAPADPAFWNNVYGALEHLTKPKSDQSSSKSEKGQMDSSYRTSRRLYRWSQANVRSTTQRCFPR